MRGVQVLLVCLSFLVAVTLVQAFHKLPTTKLFRSPARHLMSMSSLADSVDFNVAEGVSKFIQIQAPDHNEVGKYHVEGMITAKVLKEYMREYKEELKKQKSAPFKGFRPGSIPPYAMPDVRRTLICFGLESIVSEVCEVNNLKICNEAGAEVDLSSEKYYDTAILPDAQQRNFEQQREAWREGTNFSFTMQINAMPAESEPTFANDEEDSTMSMSSKFVDTVATSD